VVKQKVGPCKTEASQKPIPLDTELAEQLWNWRHRARYNQPEDWIFASPHRRGRQPYWPGALFRVQLKPGLEAAGIPGSVGWHTLRHTFGTLMKANGEDIKTIQELLRHANYKVTADIYTAGDDQDEARGANPSRENDSAGDGHQKGELIGRFFLIEPSRTHERKGQFP
jgi:integrase